MPFLETVGPLRNEALVGLATTLGDEALFGACAPVEQLSRSPKTR